ncbi:MAG: Pyrimidine-nucleoside phosphorylase [Candidatus Marinimicrobia bacterium]|nr:Pyrimidine-nucleoside phosphorylase [Candidatus Neomarinimicrobiota bacterium]
MIPYEIIEKKQNGHQLSKDEIQVMVRGFTDGTIPDYQISAWLMAIYFQGFSTEETAVLVDTMLHSGERIDLSELTGYKADKHSTGGVGDKVSLILGPLVAAAGVQIPMISGRGLGHTGGTLDKLESIPNFTTDYTIDKFKQQVADIGLCIMSQNNNIVPADKKMYALRDVTATVKSIPLICGSIMSKKIAEGIDGLVLDVKTGRGAFISEYEQTKELAQKLVAIGREFDLDVRAIITDMNQPLGSEIGNWNEVVESIDCLKGNGPDNLMEVTMELSVAMVVMAGKAGTDEEAKGILREKIENGQALEKFYEFVEAQQGDVDSVQNLEKYPKSKYIEEIRSPEEGIVQEIDSYKLGMTSVQLGAGRLQMGDELDPKAGISLRQKVGDSVKSNEALATIMTEKEDVLERAKSSVLEAFSLGEGQVTPPTMIHESISSY